MTIKLPQGIRLANIDDVPNIRKLVNAAYKELADLGLNYTGTYQDEGITRDRMRSADVFVLERNSEIIASINLSVKDADTANSCLYINQLAVNPNLKRQGIGKTLMALAEARAMSLGFRYMRLDTAISATHLVAWYLRLGYRTVSEVQWDGKTYRSYIMEKDLELITRDFENTLATDL